MNLKKKILFLTLLLPLQLFAEGISPEKAAAVAGTFWKESPAKVRLAAQAQIQTRSLSREPAWYVFDNSDAPGFVIVSGEDSVTPIIGYCNRGSYNPYFQPENFKGWMEMWTDIIESRRLSLSTADATTRQEWETVLAGDREAVYGSSSTELETAQWGQMDPYNYYCPSFSGSTCPTGCTATATGIVMRYHQWPSCGTGTIPDYSYRDDDGVKREMKGRELGEAYDWENMPLEMGNDATIEQQKAVARLLYDIGLMIQSEYNAEGTGAYVDNVPPALEKYMSYDGSVEVHYCEYSTSDQWASMLRDEMDSRGPVIYSAYSKDNGGHAFVLDGYNKTGKFRINWGWDGDMNGYYAIPAFDEFTEGHTAILDIKPDEGGTSPGVLILDGKGIYTDTEEYATGVPFNAYCENVYNVGSRKIDAYVSLVKVNRALEVQEVFDIDTVTFQAMYGGAFYYEPVVIETPVEIGDKLVMAYYTDEHPEWRFMSWDPASYTVGEIPIADSETLEETTTVKYTSEKASLVISTKKEASFRLENSSGEEVNKGLTAESGVLTVDCTKLPLDTYTLTVTKKQEKMTLKLKMGKL